MAIFHSQPTHQQSNNYELKNQKNIIPAVVIAATAAIVMFIQGNPPQANRFAAPTKAQISVAVQLLTPQSYQVMIDSFGTVKPRTQSGLVAQASGQIIAVSEQFREGGFFEKGDVLLQLDDRDHRAEVKAASKLINCATGLTRRASAWTSSFG